MKKSVKILVLLMFIGVISCNAPDTVVTNYVHPDGSVTRKIEMKSREKDIEKRFKISNMQVPVDSTWTMKDSIELDKKGDTTWVRRAEKLFGNIAAINLDYKLYTGTNKAMIRQTSFNRRFRWFNTEYRFSEEVEKKLKYGYPVKYFLNKEELGNLYSPESLKSSNEAGPDSIRYKALSDSVKVKTDKWTTRNLIAEWIGEFSNLTRESADSALSYKSLKMHENEYVKLIESDDKNLDSLWKNGIILKEFIGEADAVKYKTEADSALTLVTNNLLADFNDYTVSIVMPGKLIATNGFITADSKLIWPVKSEYFMTEKYEMWAESKIPNIWAWIISGLFLAFVISGIVLRKIKKD